MTEVVETEEVSFECTDEEYALISVVVDRAETRWPDLFGGTENRMDLTMDITAVHANGCPLDLEALLNAKTFDFGHDVLGISRRIDRATGHLTDCFLPRCAVTSP